LLTMAEDRSNNIELPNYPTAGQHSPRTSTQK
jgi:hypothetical protein